MSSESTPVVIIDYDNPSGFYWDVSTITTKVVYEYGRNRPFALAEVVVKKAYFNSDTLYWNKVARCPTDSDGKVILPNIVLGETTIHIEAYGESYNMYIEKMTSNDDYITLLCYNSAYKLKSALYLSSLTSVFSMLVPVKDESTNETVMVKKYYLESDPLNPLNVLPSEDNRLRLEYVLNISDTQHHSIIINCILINASTIKVDYIEGLASDVFRFIAINGAGYDAGNCIVDEGYSYNYNIFYEEGTDLILNEYTEDQIRQIKSTTPYIIPSDDYVKLRVNYLCWDVLKALGYLSNRYPFFYDHAYFVDYNNSAYCNTFKEMKLDYGVDEKGQSKSYTIDTDDNYQALNIYAIVDSLDQGTTYVMSGQEVVSENHSEYVYITDAVHPVEGKQIVFPYPEVLEEIQPWSSETSYERYSIIVYEGIIYFSLKDENLNNIPPDSETYWSKISEGTSFNQIRDKFTKKLALQRMTTYYRPLDCIQFTISEIDAGGDNLKIDGVVFDESELPVAPASGTIYQVTDGLMNTYYIYQSADGWQPYTFATYSNTRKSRFDVYTCIDDLTDAQNNIHMVNAPLSYVQLSWPECVTTLSFGNPEFIDSAWQLANLEQGNETSVAEGTTDLSISDRQAAKIVVGNQTLSDLNDDRTGFTGLILEKNRDKELYRLAGYNDGELEAFFDSKGRILSGNASFSSDGVTLESGVMIDHTGIVITGSKGNYVEYTESGGTKVTNLSDYTMSTDGTSKGTIVLNGSGMTTRNSSGTIQCEVTTEGKISAGSGKVVLDANGISINDINGNTQLTSDNTNGLKTAKGSVTINSEGLTTWNGSTIQCYVGSDGTFYAGGGKVRLDSNGLKVMNGSSVLCKADSNGIYSGNGAVFIDDDGLKTYNSSRILQCRVGVDGAMTAGAGAVRLSSTGVTINVSSKNSLPDNTNSYLRFNTYSDVGNADNQFVIGTTSGYKSPTGNTPPALSVQFINKYVNSDEFTVSYISQLLLKLGAIITDADLVVLPPEIEGAKNHVVTCITNFSTGNKWYYILSTNNIIETNKTWVFPSFMECGGFLSTSVAGTYTINFPVTFTTVYGCECTTIPVLRDDYVSSITTSTIKITTEGGGGGVYWRAWGIVYIPLSHSY